MGHDKSLSHQVVYEIFEGVLAGFEKNDINISPRQYRMCLSGLNRMSLNDEAVAVLLEHLNHSLNFSSHDTDNWGFPISTVLSGLINMSNEHAVVRKSIGNIARILEDSMTKHPNSETHDYMHISSCFYSLRNMSSAYAMDEVEHLISLLNTLLGNFIKSRGKIHPHEVGGILHGLQHIDIDRYRVAQETLALLVDSLRDHTSQSEFKHISHMLLGLSSSNGNSNTVRVILQEIVHRMGPNNSSDLMGFAVVRMVRGLQTMNTDYGVVLDAWECLLDAIKRKNVDMSLTEYTDALNSLKSVSYPHSIHQEIRNRLALCLKK